jgi:hypothetical protein
MISLPVWFSDAFGHLEKQDADVLKHLWETESVLREAAARLDEINPLLLFGPVSGAGAAVGTVAP